MIEIIRDKKSWKSLIECIPESDFYHSYDYHHLSKNEDENPVLIKYQKDGKIIALPLLIRKIEGTPYRDATSVYGYPGPVSAGISESFDSRHFADELEALFLESNIVSIFSRLNPYIPHQEICLKNMGEVFAMGKVVNIDISKCPEEQWNAYQKRLRTYIRQSSRLCTVREASTEEDLNAFMALYYDNMQRVHADDRYFFDAAYFCNLLNSVDFEAKILLADANDTGETIAGALFIRKDKIVQYHLSGSREDYLHYNAIKLIIDRMRVLATEEGCKYFNLGGGVGNQKDSLFYFKSKFSDDLRDFKIWRYPVNEKIYNELVHLKLNQEAPDPTGKCESFFPRYRCTPAK